MTRQFGAGELSPQYDKALKFASDAHRKQMRKSGEVPYLSHLLRVSGLVLDYGASEEVAIAALLHDVVEDCGGMEAYEEIRREFGENVASIVLETSDSTSSDPDKKLPWCERKENYINRLADESEAAALIAACDKLDNVTSLTRALLISNDRTILTKFKGGKEGSMWYWNSIIRILRQRKIVAAEELANAVARLEEIW